MKIEKIRKMGSEIGYSLKMPGYPVGIKLLKNKNEVPEGAIIPTRDLGFKMALCQALSMSGDGHEKIIAMFKEDHYCFEPIVGLGLISKQKGFFNGTHRYPDSAKTLEAGVEWCRNMPSLEEGKYQGIVTAPIHKLNFMPDLIFMHVNGLMLTFLLVIKNYIDGKDLHCQLSGHAACVYAIVPAINERRCYVTIPCKGDRMHGGAKDSDIIFTIIPEILPDFIDAIHFMQKKREWMPITKDVKMEYPISPRYKEYREKIDLL